MSLLKFVVLSDLHLGLPGLPVNGLDTGARLAEAVQVINNDDADAAFVLLAGDLADRRNAADHLAVLRRHSDIQQVIAGHVHLPSAAVWRGIPMTTLAGSHYSVSPHVPGVPGRQRLGGPAQMAVVLATADGVTVHFQDHCERHRTLAPGPFH